jgi:hypothetical protein
MLVATMCNERHFTIRIRSSLIVGLFVWKMALRCYTLCFVGSAWRWFVGLHVDIAPQLSLFDCCQLHFLLTVDSPAPFSDVADIVDCRHRFLFILRWCLVQSRVSWLKVGVPFSWPGSVRLSSFFDNRSVFVTAQVFFVPLHGGGELIKVFAAIRRWLSRSRCRTALDQQKMRFKRLSTLIIYNCLYHNMML